MPAKLAGVTWTGLDSFKAELQVLTAELVDEANGIMVQAAFDAADDIRAAYPLGETGNLRGGLKIIPERGTLLAGAKLLQTAPHGFLYEHGSQMRQTTFGANRGRMRATPTFVPTAAAYRRSAISAVMFRLYQHGATKVSGDAEE